MKVGIVGAGMVGSATAYAMAMRGIGREIMLVDIIAARAQAEAADIQHAVSFTPNPLRINAGDYPDLAGSDVVVITAGLPRKADQSRLVLMEANARIFQEMVPSIVTNAPDAILVVVSNPVDVMTHLTARYAAEHGIPSHRVIGTGTGLDTARFRAALGRYLGVDAKHVNGYVVGEHGDSQVLAWSSTTVGGVPLVTYCQQRGIKMDKQVQAELQAEIRRGGAAIIAGKGATYYGIGSVTATLVDVILRDERAVMAVCTPTPDVQGVLDVTLSLPRLIDRSGVVDTFPVDLDDEECAALGASAQVLRDAIDSLDAAMAQ
ncbi:MAG: L-lactate dehydrogenase [Anaerolineae bacterium]